MLDKIKEASYQFNLRRFTCDEAQFDIGLTKENYNKLRSSIMSAQDYTIIEAGELPPEIGFASFILPGLGEFRIVDKDAQEDTITYNREVKCITFH